MVSTSTPLSLLAGERIAQILLLPYHPFLAFPNERTGGFGSTGRHIFWEMLIKDSRPILSLIIQGKNFEGLIDTGANVSQSNGMINLPFPNDSSIAKTKGD